MITNDGDSIGADPKSRDDYDSLRGELVELFKSMGVEYMTWGEAEEVIGRVGDAVEKEWKLVIREQWR